MKTLVVVVVAMTAMAASGLARGADYYLSNRPGSGLGTKDEQSWELLPKWKTAGRDADAVGPENVSLVLDLRRYGPAGRDYKAGKALKTERSAR